MKENLNELNQEGYPYSSGDRYYVGKLISLLEKELEKQPKVNFSRRVFSPRMHGFFHARFIVDKELPEKLRIGLFKEPGKEYTAKIRYSSAHRSNRLKKKDVRGMAIRLYEKGSNQGIQDFLLASSPFFRSRNLKQTYIGLRLLFAGTLTSILGGILWPYTALVALKSLKKAVDLFNFSFYSQTAYTFGDPHTLVKYVVQPEKIHYKDHYDLDMRDENYLSHVFKKRLAELPEGGAIAFHFFLQFQTSNDNDPEDPMIAWKGSLQKVATILIHKQDFDQPQRYQEGQDMDYNVGNCLKEHQYFGAMNWGRDLIYRKLYEYRTRNKQAPENGQ